MLEQEGVRVRIASFGGGQAKNAIPGAAKAVITFAETDLEKVKGLFDRFKTEFDEALAAITIGSVNAGTDGKKPTENGTTVSEVEVSSPLLTASQNYLLGSLYMGYDDAGNGFYRIATNTGTAFDPKVEGSAGTVSLNWANMGSASWSKGYTAVPEPSTAVLALAGLALLLKRRRA